MTSTPRGRYPVVALALVLAGCAPARPASHPAGPPDAAVVDLATRSGSWPATQHLLDTAVSLLAHRCLAAHGFNDPDMAQPPPPSPEDEAAAIDMPTRKQHGYGIVPDGDDSQAQQPADPYYARLSPQDQKRYDTVLFGPPGARVELDIGGGQPISTPSQGCEADARRGIAGDLVAWVRIFYDPDYYDNRLSEQASTAPRYLAALAAWHSCMAARGYAYQTPDAARDAMHDRYRRVGATAEFRQQEITVAVADGECASQVHLPSTALAVRRSLVSTLPEADRRALADVATHRAAAVRRAAAVSVGTADAGGHGAAETCVSLLKRKLLAGLGGEMAAEDRARVQDRRPVPVRGDQAGAA